MTTTLLPRRLAPVHYLLSFLALGNIVLLGIVAANHLRIPFGLDPTETTALNQVKLSVYPSQGAPASLYHYLCSFSAHFFGLTLTTLREVTLLATAGCALILFLVTLRETRSKWWALMTVGLFAASYRALDGALDAAHSDMWLVFLILMGCYWIGYSETRLRDALGTLFLVAAFWTQPQQGAAFTIGGLAFLLWRDLRTGSSPFRSWPSLLMALSCGPVLYWALRFESVGPILALPLNQWTGLTREQVRVFAEFLGRWFALPAILAGAGLQLSLERGRPLGVWGFFLPVAFLSTVLAGCTAGATIVTLMPLGIWLILNAMLALSRLSRSIHWLDPVYFPAIALGLSFWALSYRPAEVLIPEVETRAIYQDLQQYIAQLDRPVYATSLEQPSFRNDEEARQILKPVTSKPGYILESEPLGNDPALRYVADSYILEQDLGDRFKLLGGLARQGPSRWPRYLYRYDPRAALRLSATRTRP